MYGTLAAYVTNAVIRQCNAMLAGYTSRQGTALNPNVARAFTTNPASMTLPDVWVQGLPPDELTPNLIGDALGTASDGTSVTRGLLFDEEMPLRANLGVRARQPAERDDLFDYLALSFLLALDPNSQVPWKQEIWASYGLQPIAVGRPVYSTQELSGAGEVFEVQVQLAFLGQLAVTVLTTPITSVTLGPTIDAGAYAFPTP